MYVTTELCMCKDIYIYIYIKGAMGWNPFVISVGFYGINEEGSLPFIWSDSYIYLFPYFCSGKGLLCPKVRSLLYNSPSAGFMAGHKGDGAPRYVRPFCSLRMKISIDLTYLSPCDTPPPQQSGLLPSCCKEKVVRTTNRYLNILFYDYVVSCDV